MLPARRRTALRASGGLRSRRVAGGFRLGIRLLAGFADVDAALEERSVFDADALRDDIAGQRAFIADVNAIAGIHVAAYFAEDHDLARVDVGGDDSVAPDGYAIAGEVDRTFDASIDIERLGARDLAFDDQRLAYRGLILCRSRRGALGRGAACDSSGLALLIGVYAGRWGSGDGAGVLGVLEGFHIAMVESFHDGSRHVNSQNRNWPGYFRTAGCD